MIQWINANNHPGKSWRLTSSDVTTNINRLVSYIDGFNVPITEWHNLLDPLLIIAAILRKRLYINHWPSVMKSYLFLFQISILALIFAAIHLFPTAVIYDVTNRIIEIGTKRGTFRELPTLPPKFPTVGYSRVETLNCTHPLCRLNRGRTPLRIREGQGTCEAVSECVTLITKTRFRLTPVSQMIQSFWRYYPSTPVIVADDYNPHYPGEYGPSSPWFTVYQEGRGNVTYIQTEEGISQGRNMALRLATTKYVLLTDDDILFTNKTDVSTMLRLLEDTDASIVGGTYENGATFDFLIRIHQSNDSVRLGRYGSIYYQNLAPFAPCYVTDCVHNFILFNRDHILRTGAWDPKFRIYEHGDFFMSMRDHGIKVLYCPDITVFHNKTVSRECRKDRMKQFDKFSKIRQLKWGFTVDDYCMAHKYSQQDECVKFSWMCCVRSILGILSHCGGYCGGCWCLGNSSHRMDLLPDTYDWGLRMRRECRECFLRHQLQRKPLVSDPGMHHGTCVTHVPWCMSGSLTCGGGENVPGIPGACPTRNFTYLVRGSLAKTYPFIQ